MVNKEKRGLLFSGACDLMRVETFKAEVLKASLY